MTLHEKSTNSSTLFTNLKQKLQICKHFVNGVQKTLWDILLSTQSDTPTSSQYAENLKSMPLLRPLLVKMLFIIIF